MPYSIRYRNILLIMLLCRPVLAIATPLEDTQKGIDAYNRGDVVAAMELYRKAAEAGYVQAQVRLAYILDQSELNEEAIIWYRKAVAQNNAEGKYGLGQMYLTGDGVAKDVKKAVALFTEAAEQGLARAMRNLAKAYETGDLGLTLDYKQAVHWTEKAAESGDQWSISRLVQAYRKGELGLPVDTAKATQWESIQSKKIQ